MSHDHLHNQRERAVSCSEKHVEKVLLRTRSWVENQQTPHLLQKMLPGSFQSMDIAQFAYSSPMK
jgi:hypothetical protein